MKEVQAFIRPRKLNDVYNALKLKDFCCMTVYDGEGTGRYTDPDNNWPSFKFTSMHSKVVKLEMVCKQEHVKSIVNIIHEKGSTGRKGDGIIYISDVEEVIRIRDGEKGEEILN